MASSYNRVILMGRLTRDPQPGTLPSGTAVCELGLAANRRWRDRDGATHEDVLFIDCTAYGKVAEALGQYLKKGRPVHVEGHLKLDRWEQDGQPRSKVRVVIEQFRFVDSDRTEGRTADAAKRPPTKRRGGRRAAPAVAAVAANAAGGGDGGDDALF
jgi:single-strand DNA-binding protein